jgi:hypothetical protein
MPVKTLDTIVNKEPDKHPEIRKAHYTQLTEILGLDWAPQLGPFIQENASSIRKSIVRLL